MELTKRYILIQRADEKTAEWARSMPANVELIALPGSAVKTPLLLITSILTRKTLPAAIVVRYLNDYASIWRTVFRTTSEVTTLLLCALLRIRLIWLCHNVDRESDQHHPRLSKIRRKLHRRAADTILVTDPMLIAHAERRLAMKPSIIRATCFGDPTGIKRPKRLVGLDKELIERFVKETRSNASRKVLIGFCVGTPDKKKLDTYRLIPELIVRAQHLGVEVRFIVVGPVRDMIARALPEVLEFLERDPRVLFIGDRYVTLEMKTINTVIDFFWRVHGDISVPYSAYYAAGTGKPILTIDVGFLAEMVQYYRLGVVIDVHLVGLDRALHDLRDWDQSHARRFLSSHNWRHGAYIITSSAI